MPNRAHYTIAFLEKLRKNRFFGQLSDEHLLHFVDYARQSNYRPNETIFSEGESAQGLYWLSSGALKAVRTSASGKEQTLHFVKSGQTFNELGAFSTLPNPASVIALEPSTVWRIPGGVIRKQVQQDPAFAQLVIDTLSLRLRYQVSLIEELSLKPVANRLAALILVEAEGDVFIRPNWLTQSELAARLGTVEDVVRRSLRKLTAANLIAVNRQKITILNRTGLEKLAT